MLGRDSAATIDPGLTVPKWAVLKKKAAEEESTMSAIPSANAANDPDVLETQEWLDALDGVIEREGPERAHYLLEKLVEQARRSGAYIPFSPNTAYVNTIPLHQEAHSPGDAA